MPLKKGKNSIGYNIKELQAANKSKSPSKKRSKAQLLAIALKASRGK